MVKRSRTVPIGSSPLFACGSSECRAAPNSDMTAAVRAVLPANPYNRAHARNQRSRTAPPGVDQVPQPRLGARHDGRGAGDRAARVAPRVRQPRLLQRRHGGGGLPHRSGRAGRPGGERPVLPRAPTPGRERQHHRPGDRHDRHHHLSTAQPRRNRPRSGAVGEGRHHRQGRPQPGLRRRET
jgi:hypothetical protein